ncbi:hypothetical protein E4U39_000279, partial [Claviceps sp. Clav50 group G5]
PLPDVLSVLVLGQADREALDDDAPDPFGGYIQFGDFRSRTFQWGDTPSTVLQLSQIRAHRRIILQRYRSVRTLLCRQTPNRAGMPGTPRNGPGEVSQLFRSSPSVVQTLPRRQYTVGASKIGLPKPAAGVRQPPGWR